MPVTDPGFASSRAPTRHGHLRLRLITTLGHILMALQAVRIANRVMERCRLNGGPRKPLEGVLRAHPFSRHPSRHPLPGMAVDAKRVLGGVMRR